MDEIAYVAGATDLTLQNEPDARLVFFNNKLFEKGWLAVKHQPLLPLYLSEAFFPFPRSLLIRLKNDLTVGRMLKGGGRVDPGSK